MMRNQTPIFWKLLFTLIAFSGAWCAKAGPLDKTATFTPVVSFVESHAESIATVRDPFDTSIITHEQRYSNSTTATIVADITGIGLANIDETTAFSLTFGGCNVNFTLGDVPSYVKGKSTSVVYYWNGWDPDTNKALGGTYAKLTWSATRLTVNLLMANEDMRPAAIVTDDALPAGPGAFKGSVDVTLSFGSISTENPCKVWVTGASTVKHVVYPSADAPEEFDLTAGSFSGAAEFVAPVITLTTPKQGAVVGAATTLSGRVVDLRGVDKVEWSELGTGGPWTDVDTLTDVPGIINPELWGTTTKAWSVAVTGIPPGTHKYYLRATDIAGNVSAPFLVTLVNAVPQIVSGRWDAVLTQTAPTDLRGGLYFTFASSGSWTGRLSLEGVVYDRLLGTLDRDGAILFAIKRTGKPDLVLKGTVQNFSPATIDVARVDGTIEENSVVLASWSALRSPWAATNLASVDDAGRFHCSVSPLTYPSGTGYLVVTTTRAGAATIIGSLADGTAVAWSGVMSAGYSLPVFLPLYAGKGSLSGTLAIAGGTHSVPAASLRWVRPAAYVDKQFAAGWNEVVTVAGGLFTPLAAGTRVLGLTTLSPKATASWIGDGVSMPASQVFTVNANNTILADAPNSPGFTASLPGTTGLCTGVFKMLPTAVPATWRGLIIGTQVQGYYIAPAVLPAVQKRYGKLDIVPN